MKLSSACSAICVALLGREEGFAAPYAEQQHDCRVVVVAPASLLPLRVSQSAN